MHTVEYAPGRLADVFGSGASAQPTVLMWHGAQKDARSTMRTLADLVARHGFNVVVPDWDSHTDDAGRADLMRSVRFAAGRVGRTGEMMLVGWSLGGVAAAGLTIQAPGLGVRLARTACLAGAFSARDPISGACLPADLPREGQRTPFTLLHGVADDVVSVDASRAFASTLQRNDWPVELVELDTDHGGIAGASYDPVADRYSVGTDAKTLAVAADVAERVTAGL
jgi:dienelactone hydrolase